MTLAATLCDDCGTAHDPFDNYCRNCGANLRIRRLPALVPDRLPARASNTALPPFTGVVGRGLMALAAARLLGWGARYAAQRVVQTALAQPGTRAATAPATARPVLQAAPITPAAGRAFMTVATLVVQQLYAPEPAPPAEVKRSRRRWPFPAR